MGKLELSQIKQILEAATSEIQIVQKEAMRDHGNISNLKIEKLKQLFDKSENALKELKNVNISLSPKIKSSDIQNAIDSILKMRANKGIIDPAVLQIILAGLQNINSNLGEIRLDETDHKRGVKVEKVNNEKL